MAQDRINSVFDLEKLAQELQQFTEMMQKAGVSLGEVAKSAQQTNTAFSKATSIKDAGTAMKDADQAARQLTAGEKELTKAMERYMLMQDKHYQKAQGLKKEFAEQRREVQALARAKDILKNSVSTANMSLGEMQRELTNLRNTSFKGLSEEMKAGINARMADLTDRIGKAQGQLKLMAMDTAPFIARSLQGVAAAAQVVVGTMTMLGVSAEKAQKLQQQMVALIGVTQALKTIDELYKANIIKVMALKIGNAAATTKLAIATKLQTMATQGATVATRVLGKTILASPIGWFAAALAGVAIGIVALVKHIRESNREIALQNEMMGAWEQSMLKAKQEQSMLLGTLEQLSTQLKDTSKTEEERSKILDKYNEVAKANNLHEIDKNSSLSIQNGLMEKNIELMGARMMVTASESRLQELYNELFEEELQLKKDLEQQEKANAQTQAMSNHETTEAIQSQAAYTGRIEKRIKASSINIAVLQEEINKIWALNGEYQILAESLGIGTEKKKIETTTTRNLGGEYEQLTRRIAELTKKYKDILAAGGEVSEQQQTELKDLQKRLAEINAEYDRMFANREREARQQQGNQQSALADATGYYENLIKIKNEEALNEVKRREETLESVMKAEGVSLDERRAMLEEYYINGLIDYETFTSGIRALDDILTAKRIENLKKLERSTMNMFASIIEISNNKTEKMLQNAEIETEAEKAKLDKQLMGEEAYNAAISKLEDDLRDKRRQAAQEEAKRQKAYAMFSIILDSAKGIMKVWADEGASLWEKLIWTALVTAEGALQYGAVASQPIPTYAKGRDGGKAETAVVGEKGFEIIDTGKGMFLTPNYATLMGLGEGWKVFPHEQSKQMLSSGLEVMELRSLGQKLDNVTMAINSRPEYHTNVTAEGIYHVAVSGNQRTTYIGGLKK